MALDKLVDSTQLDSDLTSVANAIRTKSGGSSQLAFPAGFVSEIGNIPSGGGDPYEIANKLITRTLTTFESDVSGTISGDPFYKQSNLTRLSLPNVTKIGAGSMESASYSKAANFARYCTALSSVYLPKVSEIYADYMFGGCTALTVLVLPSLKSLGNQNTFRDMTNLAAFDCGNSGITASGGFGQNAFYGDSALTTIILRQSTIRVISNLDVFKGTPFASGGTGGTIYIPKSLYDHLGDGTADDYKAASNWSTIDGYGTITWAKIEGSQYENYYADGTAIPT